MMQPWEIEELEKLRREQRPQPREQPLLPLELPLEDEPPAPLARQPENEVERGVFIFDL